MVDKHKIPILKEKICKGKKQYLSETDAKLQAALASIRDKKTITHYPCPKGPHFHIGHPTGMGVEA